MDSFGYFLAAYLVAGAGVIAYVVRLCAIRRSLRRQIESLRAEAKRRHGD
jgi:hypothetical protein